MCQTKGFAVVKVASSVGICRWHSVAGCISCVSDSDVVTEICSAAAAGVDVSAVTVAATVG